MHVGQGSGWGWLGYSKEHDKLVYASTPNQDPLVTQVCTDTALSMQICFFGQISSPLQSVITLSLQT